MSAAGDAKRFLIAKIVAEAEREGVLLSDLERRMLHFSEVSGEPRDWKELNEEFERIYDSDEYEKKIAQLIRNARKREPQELDAWSSAIRVLSKEDHYLLVMIDQSGASEEATRPRFDSLKLFFSALGVIAVMAPLVLVIAGLSDRFPKLTRDRVGGYIWTTGFCCVILFSLLRWILKPQRVDAWMSRALDKLLRHR